MYNTRTILIVCLGHFLLPSSEICSILIKIKFKIFILRNHVYLVLKNENQTILIKNNI